MENMLSPKCLIALIIALSFGAGISRAQTSQTLQQPDTSSSQQTAAAPAVSLTAPPSSTNPLIAHSVKCNKSYYPAIKVHLGNEGTTFVNVTVGTDGSVKNVTLAQSSGHQELDEAAVDCIATRWHFKPAMQDGQPVEFTKQYAIKWKLQP